MTKTLMSPFVPLRVAILSFLFAAPAFGQGPVGTWRGTEGRTIFTLQPDGTLRGDYPKYEGGRIIGTLQGLRLVGYWHQVSSNQRCEAARNGTYHWGRIVLTFTPDWTAFKGSWSYCDSPVTQAGWDGQREPDDTESKSKPALGVPLTGEGGDLVGMVTNPTTGKTRTQRRNPDGTTTVYDGERKVDPDGTERLIETASNGNRIETAVAPDGTITVTKATPGTGLTTTTTTPDGRVETIERDAAGNTSTSALTEGGSIVTERRNAKGELLGRSTDMPSGWIEHVDPQGNMRSVFRAENGLTTTIATDRSGNTATTIVDEKGEVLFRDTNLIGPREPGRAYFEQTLKGTDWDALPRPLKARYADSERSILQTHAIRAQEDAAAARRKVEEARRTAEKEGAAQETTKRFEALQAEQAAADKVAAERKALVDRRAEVEQSYETRRALQRQYDEAIARGDKAEAVRILERQDAHSAKSMVLLQHTPAELQALQRHSDTRSKLASEITARAYADAAKKMAADSSSQDITDSATRLAKFVSIGAEMQHATKGATRSADREKALAQAKQQEILRRLNQPGITAEERDILREMQDIAVAQESGASELLASNARIAAAGYSVDAALRLRGKAVKAGANAVGAVLAKRTAARATTTTTTSAAGRVAGRTGVTVIDDGARTVAVTAGQQRAMLEARAAASLDGLKVVARDVFSSSGKPLDFIEFTRAELVRLHTTGASLTRAEVAKKAALYRARAFARANAKAAEDAKASESVRRVLDAEAARVNRLIDEAIRAGGAVQ
jgi:YD repeat-containing protein